MLLMLVCCRAVAKVAKTLGMMPLMLARSVGRNSFETFGADAAGSGWLNGIEDDALDPTCRGENRFGG